MNDETIQQAICSARGSGNELADSAMMVTNNNMCHSGEVRSGVLYGETR